MSGTEFRNGSVPAIDEPKKQPGDTLLDRLRRELQFSRAYARTDEDGTWTCGYCAVGRHKDCVIDCGCKTCNHPPIGAFAGAGGDWEPEA